MGLRSLACRIAVVAAAVVAIVVTHNGGAMAHSAIASISRQSGLAVKNFLPARDTAGAKENLDTIPTALELFLAKNPNALISGIKREDGTPFVDIDTIDNNQVVTYRVSTEGKISQYKRENNSKLIAEARAATVSISTVIAQAQAQQPHGYVDTVSIENKEGLRWKLSLDDANFAHLATIRIAAR